MTTFGFDIKIGYWNANCLSILISEDYTDDVTTATWTDITGNFTIPEEPASGYGNDFEPAGRFSLYKYAGKTLHLRSNMWVTVPTGKQPPTSSTTSRFRA